MSVSGRLWGACLSIIAMMIMACASEPEATPAPSATADPCPLCNGSADISTHNRSHCRIGYPDAHRRCHCCFGDTPVPVNVPLSQDLRD